jgi:hypothetical protein
MGGSYNKDGRRKDSKKVSKRKLPYHKPVGRTRTRWADVVQRDALKLLGIRGWRKRVANRGEWRHLMREAKARKGLYWSQAKDSQLSPGQTATKVNCKLLCHY